ncbi:hypothetical protein HWB51_gp041 [Mycobacterium phage Cuke]|uniref:Uncharacterized protein n=1 Tax=Mycobacterium phage Cuke TaxID=2079417 RepID=A0A2L1IWU2_9CAUD|nr:hypothetical protein HWB51_gp041 [Mycobacterium phage Cuke]AVD99659.1 hypothetical protein SEA_CUKE_41 [Mycobacterium phage Cuke]
MIRNDALREYSNLLEANGFAIYESKDPTFDYFVYSRMVDGRECFGSVSYDRFEGFNHSMPIKPSREHGSSMFIEGIRHLEATVEAAKKTASPTNSNKVVGRHENYRDEYWIERLYLKR